MATFEELCVQAPLRSHGVPSGIDGWNLTVEVALPTSGALLGDDADQPGTLILGTSGLSSFSWYDVTERMQGVQIERGGSPGDRPEPGTALIQLDNTDKTLSPWSQADYFLGIENPFLGPGTLVRVVANWDTSLVTPMSNLNLFTDFTIDAGITNTGTVLKYPFTFGSPFKAQSTLTNFDLAAGDSVQCETARFPTHSSSEADLLSTFGVYRTSSPTLYYVEISRQGNGNFIFNFRDGGSVTSTTVTGITDRFWRITNSVGTIFLDTSADGYTWQTRASGAIPTGMNSAFVKVHNSTSGSTRTAASGWWVAGVNTKVYSFFDSVPASATPLFTGLVESWEEQRQGLDRTGSVMVTAIETLSVLAQYDINALGAVVGLADTFTQRVQRLADAAGWSFGYDDDYTGSFYDQARTFQSTDMSQNRLTELYLTADSVDGLLMSGKDGRLRIVYKDQTYINDGLNPVDDTFFPHGALIDLSSDYTDDVDGFQVPASIDDLHTNNDDALIIGKVTLARVGGTEVVTNNTFLSNRFQPRTYTRNDFITQNPGSDADLTYVANAILSRSNETYRPESVTLDGKDNIRCLKLILLLEVGISQALVTDDVEFIGNNICAYTIRITPLNDLGLDITADIRYEPGPDSLWFTV